MKFVQPQCIPWGETPYNFEDAMKWIEKAGRTCYNSLDKMTDDSATPFVLSKAKSAHLSIIEHSNLVLRTKHRVRHPNSVIAEFKGILQSSYFRLHTTQNYVYISGNYRAFLEHALRSNFIDPEGFDGMLAVSSDMLLHYFKNIIDISLNELSQVYEMIIITDKDDVPNILKRITFEFLTGRDVTHEYVRHRRASFSQRSQRYVKENDLQIIEPAWYSSLPDDIKIRYAEHMFDIERMYSLLMNKQIGAGLKAEDARTVLPNVTATVLVMTASIGNWKWICHLRDHDAAYPPARALIKEAKQFMVNNGWLQY